MKIVGLFLVLALSVGIGVAYWNSQTWNAQSLPESYKVLSDLESKGIYQDDTLEFFDLEQKKLKLVDYKGKVVILSFWATWCEPCVDEFPSFIKLLDAYPEKIVLIAISHDDEEKDVREFVSAFQGYRQNLVLVMDKDKRMSRSFKVDRLPEGFIFDREGKLLKKIIGIQDCNQLGLYSAFMQVPEAD
ncbi:MAG: TlpA disulfide reductase family protein [Pseudomonadota bacterium]